MFLSSLTHLPTTIPSPLHLTQSDSMFWVKITHSAFQAKDPGVGELPGQRLPRLLCPCVRHTVPVPEMHISCPSLLLMLDVPGRGWELPAAGDTGGRPRAPTPRIPTWAHCAGCHQVVLPTMRKCNRSAHFNCSTAGKGCRTDNTFCKSGVYEGTALRKWHWLQTKRYITDFHYWEGIVFLHT